MQLLARCRTISAAEATADWESGLPKLWLIDRVLSLRATQPMSFQKVAAINRWWPRALIWAICLRSGAAII